MITRFFKKLSHYPKTIIGICVLLSLGCLVLASRNLFHEGKLIVNSSLDPFISRHSDAYGFFNEMRTVFGNESLVVIAIAPTGKQPLDLDFFLKLQELTTQLTEHLPGVQNVLSLTNVPQPSGVCTGKSFFHQQQAGSICESILERYSQQLNCLKRGPSTSADQASDVSLEASLDSELSPATTAPTGEWCSPEVYQKTPQILRNEAETSIREVVVALQHEPLIQKDLIGLNQTTGILVEFQTGIHAEKSEIQQPLHQLLAKFRTPQLRVAYAGESRQEYEAAKIMGKDLKKILPLSLLCMLLSLGWCFKSFRGVMIPLTVVSVGILWTTGVFCLLGGELNLVTMGCPPILISIGSAYVIHIISQFYYEVSHPDHRSRRQLLEHTIQHVLVPLGLAALTTITGFVALTVTPIPAIQELGWYSSLGVLLIVLLSLTLAPALLAVMPLPETKGGSAKLDRRYAAKQSRSSPTTLQRNHCLLDYSWCHRSSGGFSD